MSTSTKTHEDALRRRAARQDLRIEKSRRRDPRAADYGGYMLIDAWTSGIVAGGRPYAFSLTLEDVEQYLNAAVSS